MIDRKNLGFYPSPSAVDRARAKLDNYAFEMIGYECRETIYGEYIFKYHPIYGNEEIPKYYNRYMVPTIEGGDILVLSDTILAVGVSQRTHPAAIEKLAKNLFYHSTTKFETILAFDIPKNRAFMHLDTIFTQVDYDKFLIHHDVKNVLKAFKNNALSIIFNNVIESKNLDISTVAKVEELA